MTSSIATFPFNSNGKMTRKEYIDHMKQVWKRMGMIKSAEQVIVRRPILKKETVVVAIKEIEEAKAVAPVSIDKSPLRQEQKRIASIVNKPNRINAAVHKPEPIIVGAIPRKPHLRDIVSVVAHFYDTTAVDIMSDSHKPEHVAARHACFYISRKICEKSYMAIGRDYKRDHSTIVSAVTRMEKRIAADPEFDAALKHIIQAVLNTVVAKSDAPLTFWGS
jgi:Bacterial dnaA protein helix-turn-helix